MSIDNGCEHYKSCDTCDYKDCRVNKQKAKIERPNKLVGDKELQAIIAQNCILNEENAELQKQVDELKKRLHWIWAIGVDYDGCDGVESLKDLIDEMVELTQIESKDLDEYFTYNTTQGGKMNILSIVRKVERKDTTKEIADEIQELLNQPFYGKTEKQKHQRKGIEEGLKMALEIVQETMERSI